MQALLQASGSGNPGILDSTSLAKAYTRSGGSGGRRSGKGNRGGLILTSNDKNSGHQ